MKFAHCLLLLGWLGAGPMSGADGAAEIPSSEGDSVIPPSMNAADFEALFTNSPFTRSLGNSDSIILTGIARIEDEVYATLLNTETMESQIVSKTANPRGWQLVAIGGNTAELRTLTAKVQISGEQVVSVRYQKPPPKPSRSAPGAGGGPGGSSASASLSSAQSQEAKHAAVNYREGFSGDGFPRQPPSEIVERLSRLSVGQREDINRQMLGLRNRGLGLDERRRIYVDMLDRAAQGRR